MYVEPALAQLSCPIARQLLGATTSNQGLYSGNRDDVPVRLISRENPQTLSR